MTSKIKPKSDERRGKARPHPVEAVEQGERERARLAEAADAALEKLWRARFGNGASAGGGELWALARRMIGLLGKSRIPRWEVDLVRRWERERAGLVRPQRLEALSLVRRARKPEHAGWLREQLAKLDPEFARLDLFAVKAVLSSRRRSDEQTLAEIIAYDDGEIEALGLAGDDADKIRKQLVRDRQGKQAKGRGK